MSAYWPATAAAAPKHDAFLGVTWVISEIGEVGRGITWRTQALELARARGDCVAMRWITADLCKLHQQAEQLLAVLTSALAKIEQHEQAGDDD